LQIKAAIARFRCLQFGVSTDQPHCPRPAA